MDQLKRIIFIDIDEYIFTCIIVIFNKLFFLFAKNFIKKKKPTFNSLEQN